MKILFGTNILLDVFLERETFYEASAITLSIAERDIIEGWLSGTTVTTLYYLIQKSLSRRSADEHLKICLKFFTWLWSIVQFWRMQSIATLLIMRILFSINPPGTAGWMEYLLGIKKILRIVRSPFTVPKNC